MPPWVRENDWAGSTCFVQKPPSTMCCLAQMCVYPHRVTHTEERHCLQMPTVWPSSSWHLKCYKLYSTGVAIVYCRSKMWNDDDDTKANAHAWGETVPTKTSARIYYSHRELTSSNTRGVAVEVCSTLDVERTIPNRVDSTCEVTTDVYVTVVKYRLR